MNTTGAYTYVTPPTFTSITPSVGNTGGGQSVSIVGTGFVSGTSLAVTIGGSSATGVTYSSSTSITAVTPSGTAGSTWVNITNGNGGTVNTTGAYTYVTPPTFTSITPSVGNTGGGQSVSIVGTGFVSGTSLAVSIGGSPATCSHVRLIDIDYGGNAIRDSRIHLGQYHERERGDGEHDRGVYVCDTADIHEHHAECWQYRWRSIGIDCRYGFCERDFTCCYDRRQSGDGSDL